jgi:hypothetical protein
MLRKEVDHSVKMAELIEYNLEDVNSAILAVRVALAKGMGWEDLARMVKDEKKAGNPVAGLIDKLHFEKNCMALLIAIISMKWMMMKRHFQCIRCYFCTNYD